MRVVAALCSLALASGVSVEKAGHHAKARFAPESDGPVDVELPASYRERNDQALDQFPPPDNVHWARNKGASIGRTGINDYYGTAAKTSKPQDVVVEKEMSQIKKWEQLGSDNLHWARNVGAGIGRTGIHDYYDNGLGTFNQLLCNRGCPAGSGLDGEGGHECNTEHMLKRTCGPCIDNTFQTGIYDQESDMPANECNACSAFCDPGFGIDSPGGDECTPEHDRVCTPCEEGSYNGGFSLTCGGECSDVCPAGSGTNVPGGEECLPSADITCATCPENFYNTGDDRMCVPCTHACEPGFSIDWPGGSACTPEADAVCVELNPPSDPTPPGSPQPPPPPPNQVYNPGGSLTSLPCTELCAAGSGTDGRGGDVCQTTKDRVCGPCPTGTFNDGTMYMCDGLCETECPNGSGIDATGGSSCNDQAQRVCATCDAGFFNDDTELACGACVTTCPAGQGTNAPDGTACSPTSEAVCGTCDANLSYSQDGALTCSTCITVCPAGEGTNGPAGSLCSDGVDHDAICDPCAAGQIQDGTTDTCVAVPTGHWAAAGSATSTPCATSCPAGMGITDSTGAALPGASTCSTTEPMVCVHCLAGSSQDGTGTRCNACPANQFAANAASSCTACSTSCPAGTGTDGGNGYGCSATHDRNCDTCNAGTSNTGSSIKCDTGPPVPQPTPVPAPIVWSTPGTSPTDSLQITSSSDKTVMLCMWDAARVHANACIDWGTGSCSGTPGCTKLQAMDPTCIYSRVTESEPTATVNGVSQTVKRISFRARASRGSDGCPGTQQSCMGGYFETSQLTLPAGAKITYTYKATGGSDWYEALVVLYNGQNSATSGGNVVDTYAARDKRMSTYTTRTFTPPGAGTYWLGFFAASYDFTGGKKLGAQLDVAAFGWYV